MGTMTGEGPNTWVTEKVFVEEIIERAERPQAQAEPPRLDRWLPEYDISESQHILVEATMEETWVALRGLDFAAVPGPFVRAGFALGRATLRRARQKAGLPERPLDRFTFDNLEDYGRIKLSEVPGEEIVVGAVGRLWKPESMFAPLTPDEFKSVVRPGHFKAVVSFSVRPYDDRRTLLSYEVRIRGLDDEAKKSLVTTWKLLRPLSRAMLKRVLEHVKDIAESREVPSGG